MKTFTVLSSNPTSTGNFCNKLQNKETTTVATPFGDNTSEKQTTYYLFTNKQNAIGMEAAMDLTPFDIVEKAHNFIDEDGKPQTATLKYLYPKK